MLFLLIRHCESTANNNENRLQRLPDHAVPLSFNGHGQAEQLGEFLKIYLSRWQKKIFRLWVSPYTRTRQTADHVEPYIQEWLIDRREHLGLVEQQWGLFDGLTDEEMIELYPQESEYYYRCKEHQGKFWARIPLGESPYDVANRVHESFGTFHRDYEKKSVEHNIIISHGTTNRAFAMQWLHKSPEWYDAEPNPVNGSVRLIEDTTDYGYIYKPDGKMMAHICYSGSLKGIIREYPSALCSCCMGATEMDNVMMTHDQIEAYNKKLWKEQNIEWKEQNAIRRT